MATITVYLLMGTWIFLQIFKIRPAKDKFTDIILHKRSHIVSFVISSSTNYIIFFIYLVQLIYFLVCANNKILLWATGQKGLMVLNFFEERAIILSSICFATKTCQWLPKSMIIFYLTFGCQIFGMAVWQNLEVSQTDPTWQLFRETTIFFSYPSICSMP